MLGGDPPRRPPQRNPLTRSKSCQGSTRRKRGREVLEDITWMVNHSSSWQQDGATASSRLDDDGVLVGAGRTLEESMEDEQPVAGPSSARLLVPPFQPPAASANARSLQAVNMARARSDTSLPSLDSSTSTFSTRGSQINSSSALLAAPRASLSRITSLDSSSPPSSPHSAFRYGYMGYAATGGGAGGSGSTSNRNAGLGLGRAATLPYLSTSSSTSSSGSATRRLSGATSPSLRAPPPLRRTSSSSSVSSMDGTSSSTPATSPSLLSAPFASRALARVSTVPTFTNPWTDSGAVLHNQQAPATTTSIATRVLPIPTIQREMPSPERKRSRHGSRMIEELDDEDVDEESDDDE